MQTSTMVENKISKFALLPFLMVILLDVMGIILVMPVLPPLIFQVDGGILPVGTSQAWRDFIYGLSLGLFPLFMFFSTPILGDLSDKFGRKKILLACLIGSSVSYAIAAMGIIFNSLFIFLLSRVIAGLFAGTQPIASAAIIDLSSQENKSRNLSWVVFAASIGFVIGPLLGGFTSENNLVSWFTYDTPFVIAAILSFLNAIFLLYSFKEKVIAKTDQPISFTKGFVLFLGAFEQQKFRLLSFTNMCFILGWSLYFQAIGWFFTAEYHYSTAKLGTFIGFMGLVFLLTTLIITRIATRLFSHETVTFMFFVFMMVIANIAAAVVHHEGSQWIWMIFNACGNVMCYTVSLTLFSNLAGKDSQGWIMGVTGSLGAVTWGLGGLIVGPLGHLGVRVPIIGAAVLCSISFILMLFYRRWHPEQ